MSFNTVYTVVSDATVLNSPHFICLRKFLSCKADGYLFLLFPIVPTTPIENSINSCKRGMLVKKLSMNNSISGTGKPMFCAVLLFTAR